ncbi:MAG: nuclear transport factor 2 family protein [Chloroflexi bacterium]|nr:nuclear transport factor 2 family protein [Chloroflexota bacterium]
MATARKAVVAKMEKRLALLEDRWGVQDTLYRYARSLDDRQHKAWLDCFTEDGVLEVRPPSGPRKRYAGRARLTAFITKRPLAQGPVQTQQQVVIEPLITVKGREARADSYFSRLTERDGVVYTHAFGRYRDRLVKGDDGVWRFKERIIEVKGREKGG